MKTNQANTYHPAGLILKGVITLLMVFQLAGCYSGDSAGGIINADVKDSIDNNTSGVKEVAVEEQILLSWTAPVAREDEAPISMVEIAGFRIYYGTTPGDYQQTIDVNDAYIDEIALDVPAGTYYLVMTTIDVDGRESTYSEEMVLDV
jgi:hypothetical protein